MLTEVTAMNNIHDSKEQGNILIYAAIVITFLAGLAGYLRAVSSPNIFNPSDTKNILNSDYINESFGNIFSVVTCKDLQSNLVIAPSVNKATSIIKKYKLISIISNNKTYLSNISIPENIHITYPNGVTTLKITINNTIQINNKSLTNKQTHYSTSLDDQTKDFCDKY